jgi:hypothetical protein
MGTLKEGVNGYTEGREYMGTLKEGNIWSRHTENIFR